MPLFGDDPRKFVRHNVLILDTSLDDPPPAMMRPDRTVLVKLVEVSDENLTVKRNRNRRLPAFLIGSGDRTAWETPAKLYSISPAAPGDADAYPAYICRWRENHVCTKTLGDGADVMFTGNMNGCTFGIGIAAADGTVIVGHANAAGHATGTTDNPNYAPQRQAQMAALQNQGAAARTVNPDVYRVGTDKDYENTAVTIGLRIKGKWEFYYQHQRSGTLKGAGLHEKLATTKIG